MDSSGEATLEACGEVLSKIGRESGKDAKPGHGLMCVAILLQKGITSPKTPGSTKVAFGTTEVSVDLIRKYCKNEKIMVRQLNWQED